VMKKIVFWAVLCAGVYLLIELAALTGLFALKTVRHVSYEPLRRALTAQQKEEIRRIVEDRDTYAMHDPVLGWRPRPNIEKEGLYRVNSQGIRADKEYSLTPEAGVLRVGAFGDSFTHADEVKNHETWAHRMSAKNPRVEVLNFGMMAYSLTQSHLRYKTEGVRYHPHVVFIGFMSEDIRRSVNVFWPYYLPESDFIFAKPRSAMKGDELVRLDNPLKSLSDYKKLLGVETEAELLTALGAHDYYFQTHYFEGPLDFLPSVRFYKLFRHALVNKFSKNKLYKNDVYNTQSEAFLLVTKRMEKFYRLVEQNGSVPVIVLFPNSVDMKQYARNQTRKYDPLLSYLRSQGFRHVDLMEALEPRFKDQPKEALFMPGGHYTPSGNAVVADHLLDFLGTLDLDLPQLTHLHE